MSLLIPKVFHWIWLGGEPIPDEFRSYMDGWQEKHPDWNCLLWDDENLPEIQNRAEFEAAIAMAQKASILRLEILDQFGGVYLDTDVECLRNIEPLLDSVECFIGREDEQALCNAVMGAVARHPAIQEAIVALPESVRRNADKTINHQSGPWFLTRLWRGRGNVTVFPPSVFYPRHWSEPASDAGAYPDAYAVHHWAKSWVSA